MGVRYRRRQAVRAGGGAGRRLPSLITGSLPARLVNEARRHLPGLTRGEAVWWSRPSGDRRVHGRPPTRPRTDGNPLDRVEYLRHLAMP
nr:hypothetical protein GCM10020093_050300 [Planobispora longispora]